MEREFPSGIPLRRKISGDSSAGGYSTNNCPTIWIIILG
jgi:hypothetical protein